jgi:transposase
MSDLFWLTDAQMARLAPYFPISHGEPRVDDWRVLSGIIFINCNGLRWRDAHREYGSHKTFYDRWKRWSEKGVFARIMTGLAAEHGEQKTVMIDATYLKAHRTATSMGVKKGRGHLIGRSKGGMNTKLYAMCDSKGRPLNLSVTAGQVGAISRGRFEVRIRELADGNPMLETATGPMLRARVSMPK